MFSDIKGHTLTRRNTKLMVEIIIGIIGVLGIMLSQVDAKHTNLNQVELETYNKTIKQNPTIIISNIDWIDVLF